MDLVPHRRTDHGAPRDRDAAVAPARRSLRLHLHLAPRLLRRTRLDRRRDDRRLLDRAKEAPRPRRSLSHRWRLPIRWRLELARRRRHTAGLSGCLGWPDGPRSTTTLRLRLVRRLRRSSGRASHPDESPASAHDRGSNSRPCMITLLILGGAAVVAIVAGASLRKKKSAEAAERE